MRCRLGWRGPGELKRTFGRWIRQVPLRGRFPEATSERTAELEEMRTMPAEQAQEWTRQWHEESRNRVKGTVAPPSGAEVRHHISVTRSSYSPNACDQPKEDQGGHNMVPTT